MPSAPRKGQVQQEGSRYCIDTGSSQQNPLGMCPVGQSGLRENMAKEHQKHKNCMLPGEDKRQLLMQKRNQSNP